MKYNLPTREECQEIIKNSEAFYCTKHIIEGQNVELYDYRLASITDFVSNNAFELRGLCFVEQADGSWKRNILLNKFFNLNETKIEYIKAFSKSTGEMLYDGPEGTLEINSMQSKLAPIYKFERYPKCSWLLEDIQNKKIVRVQDKRDGSLISFVKFQNGNIRAKSKMSFTSEQAVMAQSILNENKNLQDFLEYCFEYNLTPIFEITSPHNQIVLSYNNTELVLLQIRINATGEYFSKEAIEEVQKLFNIVIADEYPEEYYSFEKLMQLQRTEEDIEGYVITLEDGQMLKIKTEWYFAMHGLTTEGTRENLLIQSILEDRIDDVISLIPDGEKKEFMIATAEKVQHKFNHLVAEYKFLTNKYFDQYNDRKAFAFRYSNHELFGYIMKGLNKPIDEIEQTAEKFVKDFILNKTKKLNEAKAFLASI